MSAASTADRSVVALVDLSEIPKVVQLGPWMAAMLAAATAGESAGLLVASRVVLSAVTWALEKVAKLAGRTVGARAAMWVIEMADLTGEKQVAGSAGSLGPYWADEWAEWRASAMDGVKVKSRAASLADQLECVSADATVVMRALVLAALSAAVMAALSAAKSALLLAYWLAASSAVDSVVMSEL